MGQIFQRTYRAKDGTRKTCETWTIRYFRAGRAHQEATRYRKFSDAERTLKSREGKIADGVPVTAQSARYKFEDAERDIVAEYTANGRRSLSELQRRIRLHLKPVFGGRRMAEITTSAVRAFTTDRLDAKASAGEINRELAVLRRMFSIAVKDNRLLFKPHVPMLQEHNVRSGFFDTQQFQAVRGALPAALRPVVTFAYVTGWRIHSEVLPLEWRNVDRKAGEVRLDPGTTKNQAGRVFPFTDELARLFAALWAAHEKLAKQGTICPYVFQRGGKQIKSLRGAWAVACETAGCPGRIPHDLRRSAVRNMERSGLSRSVAMQLTGHKTESVYRRYAITSEADLREGVARLNTAPLAATGTTVTVSGQSRRSGTVARFTGRKNVR